MVGCWGWVGGSGSGLRASSPQCATARPLPSGEGVLAAHSMAHSMAHSGALVVWRALVQVRGCFECAGGSAPPSAPKRAGALEVRRTHSAHSFGALKRGLGKLVELGSSVAGELAERPVGAELRERVTDRFPSDALTLGGGY